MFSLCLFHFIVNGKMIMRANQNVAGRLTVLGLSMFVFATVGGSGLCQAATLYWEGRSIESGGVFLDSWDVGITANWNLGAEAGPMTTFTNGDAVIFKDDGGGNNDNGTVIIAAGGVSPASIVFNRGFGKVYTSSGGDILTGSMSGIRDDTKNFVRDGSYSFGGGLSITAGGSNFNYSPASPGTYNFGTGTISITNGSFNFNPGSPATLTNNFNLGGGTVAGNANATFTGTATVTGSSINAPASSPFVFPTISLTQDTTINMSRCCGAAPAEQFNSNINGFGVHSVTLSTGTGNADWISRVGNPTGSWDVKNITKTQRGLLQFDANNPNDFFTGVKANGGAFYHRGGTIQFRNEALVNIATLDLDFPFIFNPEAAMIGPNPNQTGAGFFGLTTLNVNNNGLLGGVGTVARARGLGGHNPTFDATVNVNVFNGGVISPGLSAGALAIHGNLNFVGDTSQFVVELGGTVAGVSYDQLNVTGSATLNGLLDVSFLGGFHETVLNSDTFTILNAASIAGMFDNLDINSRVLTSDGAGSFLVSLLGNSLVLSNFLPTPAPEPSSVVLLGLGMICLAKRRRNARR